MFSVFTAPPQVPQPATPVTEEKAVSAVAKPVPTGITSVSTKGQLKVARAAGNIGISAQGRRKGRRQKKDIITHSSWNILAQPFPERTVPMALNRPYVVYQSYKQLNAFTTSTTVETFQSFTFIISSLPQLGTLTALFDQYMIESVELWIVPQATPVYAGELVSVVDLDDSTNLTSVDSALEYPTAKISSMTEGHYLKFRPHMALAAYSGSFTSYANVEGIWIDAASSGVVHYGVKVAATTTPSTIPHDIFVRMKTVWRNVR